MENMGYSRDFSYRGVTFYILTETMTDVEAQETLDDHFTRHPEKWAQILREESKADKPRVEIPYY